MSGISFRTLLTVLLRTGHLYLKIFIEFSNSFFGSRLCYFQRWSYIRNPYTLLLQTSCYCEVRIIFIKYVLQNRSSGSYVLTFETIEISIHPTIWGNISVCCLFQFGGRSFLSCWKSQLDPWGFLSNFKPICTWMAPCVFSGYFSLSACYILKSTNSIKKVLY